MAKIGEFSVCDKMSGFVLLEVLKCESAQVRKCSGDEVLECLRNVPEKKVLVIGKY